MTATIKARTARVGHLCENCHWIPSLRGKPTIAPGHRYLLHTAFPDGDLNMGDRPFSVKECIACLSERDDTAPLLVAGACSTFCCGDVPCARPLGHDDDHSCRRCLDREPLETVPSRPHVDEPRLDRPIVNVPLPALEATNA